MKRKNDGITLIALIITIIVLIILAGVTISMVVSDNGIITKAKEAKQNMTNASKEEDELIKNLLNEIKGIEGESGGEIEIPEGTIEFGEVRWSSGKAEVEIKAKPGEGENLQYQVNGSEAGNWKEIASGEKITELQHGDTVNVRLWNGETALIEKSKKIEDTKAPEVTIQIGNVTDTSIEVIVQAVENETGLLEAETYEYCIGENETLDGKSVSNRYVYQKELQPETEYKLTVKVSDKAGNVGRATIKSETGKEIFPFTNLFVEFKHQWTGEVNAYKGEKIVYILEPLEETFPLPENTAVEATSTGTYAFETIKGYASIGDKLKYKIRVRAPGDEYIIYDYGPDWVIEFEFNRVMDGYILPSLNVTCKYCPHEDGWATGSPHAIPAYYHEIKIPERPPLPTGGM